MPDAIDQLLIQSRQIIEAWEAMGAPGGRPEDNLRVISEHVGKLGAIKASRPGIAGTVDALAARYFAMAWRIRRKMN